MSTKIEWAEETWNPITGCTPVSEGCKNCYAKRMSARLRGRFGYPDLDEFKITFHADRLARPLHWRKPRKIFVCSMGDLFHEHVPDHWTDEIVHTMMHDNRHTFLLLTKRPDRMVTYARNKGLNEADWIWFGVTAENQKAWDQRVPILMDMPAQVRFVSVEPMLEEIDMRGWCPDWVICGAETGPKARRMDPWWAVNLNQECGLRKVPFFFKKMSGGEDPESWGLNRQEYPQ